MKGKKMRDLMFLLIATLMIGSLFVADALDVKAAETEETLAVSFVNQYAEVGAALTVETNATEKVTYSWYVDGIKINNDTNSYTPTANDLEKWIQVEAAAGTETASVKMYCSKLPVVYIDTEGGQAITSKENYIDATIKVQGNKEYSDSGILYEGATEIRGRGNSTWSQPKKPYRLKLDKKTNMFDMGKSKHWVLLANYLDESLLRNTLAYDLSGSMGMVQMSTVWVDVVMNGEYVGNYQFCENIRVDDYRVEIFDWEGFAEDSAEIIAEAEGMDESTMDDLMTYMAEESMQWITSGYVDFNNTRYQISDYADIEVPDINGGYILELDEYYDEVSKFKTNSNQPIMFKNPEFVATNSDMMAFVQTYVQAFEDAVQASDYMAEYEGEDVHYSELYDFDALVDYWLISEIFYNEEINKKSTYMYKDIDGLMMMGPIWDMDWSSGAAGTSAGATNQWATNYFNTNAQEDQWYKDLVQDPYFLMKVQERYWDIRNMQLQDMLDAMEEHYDYLVESGAADYETWLAKAGRKTTFEADYNNLKNWLNTHVTWMDGQMATEDSLAAGFFDTSDSLTLSLTDQSCTVLTADMDENAPADAIAGVDEAVVLQIVNTESNAVNADVFVNGKLVDTVSLSMGTAAYEIAAEYLTEETDTKNIIEVKAKNSSASVIAENYITVKESDCIHSYGDDWKSDEEKHWKECECGDVASLAKHSFEWIIDSEATAASNGIKHEECTVCAYKRNENTEFEYVEEPADPSDDSKDIPVTRMVAISDSEYPGTGNEGPDDLILDNNSGTHWHTNYGAVAEGLELANRWVGVSLNEAAEVYGIRFLPRANGGNGQVTEYEIQYSATDDGEWITVASGTWDKSDGSWKYVGFSTVTAKRVRIVGVHTYGNSGLDRHMSCAEFRVTGIISDESGDGGNSGDNGGSGGDVTYNYIPVSEMTATAGDYQSGDDPENAIDENESTIWHTNWEYGPSHENHWLQLELINTYQVDGFHYMPRSGSVNGVITAYEIYTSVDGTVWSKAAEGTWTEDVEWKHVSFEPVEANYVKLVTIDALSDKSSVKFASAAEVRLSGTLDGEVVEPPVEEALEVTFDNDYAEVGTALTVTVTGAESVSYSWTVGGKTVSSEASYTPTASDLEKWIEVTVSAANSTAAAKMYCSKLPVVYIDTEGGQAITSKENYIDATIKVQGNKEYSDSGVLYEGATEIRGRGNSTWSQPKKPYRLKLDKKTNLFDMGKSKHWVLLANYLDESLMRNTLSYDFSGSLGMVQMSTVWVDVVMNGEYVGNYQLCENIRVDDNRIEIFDWEGFAEESAEIIAEAEAMDENTMDDLITYMAEESMQWITSGYVDFNNTRYQISDYADIEIPDINGGYILELDEYYDEVSKFKTNSNQPIMFKNPEFVATNSDMLGFVKTYVQAFEDAVQASDYMAEYEGENVHYSELYDFDALVDYWLISEIFYNEELNKKSTYMYKDIDGLMMMGPIWDMDWSSGAAGTSAGATNQWATNYFNTNAQANQWYKDLVQDPYFLMRAQERYWEIRDVQLQDMLDVMDVHYAYLAESGAADYTTWLAKAGRSTSFEADYNNLKNWLNKHVTWMDGQMATEDSFDAAFLGKNNSLALALTDAKGAAFETDTTTNAPADALGPNGETVKLQISGASGNAKVFVNGRLYSDTVLSASGSAVEITANALNAAVDEKNVIEVKVYNTSGNVTAANYITLKTYEAEKETTPVTEVFSDLEAGAWYVESIQYVYDNGIMSGSDGLFKPTGNITRAQVVTTLYNLEGRPAVTNYDAVNDLLDVQAGMWYTDAVCWAYNVGVASGNQTTKMFYMGNPVTRQQLATFFYNYAEYKGLDTTTRGDYSGLKGANEVASYAADTMKWAYGTGLITGSKTTDGNGNTVYDLKPTGTATRAQVASILMRFCEANDL